MNNSINEDLRQFNKEKPKRFSFPLCFFLANIGAIVVFIVWIYEIKNNRGIDLFPVLNFLENIFFLIVIVIWFAANKRLKYLYESEKNRAFNIWFIIMILAQLITLVIYYLNQ